MYNKKRRKNIVFSANCNQYEYTEMNRDGINGGDTSKEPLDSNCHSNNPMYISSEGDSGKEIYINLRNTMYEEPSYANV